MNRNKYLSRIGADKFDISANLETLDFLQKQHLLKIPFENLDIHWKKPIVLDTDRFYQKIVERKRGGFCYELNGLFSELLAEIGFKNKIISARVAFGEGDFSNEYDHLAILTEINDEKFLVDVGFGDFSAAPLKVVLDIEQNVSNGTFLIEKFDEEYFKVSKKDGGVWKSEYIFKDLERDLAEFTDMCEFHQTSPESHFTHGKVCSILTDDGRKTLTDKKFITTKNAEKIEQNVDSEEDFRRILRREFSIEQDFNR